MTYTHETAAYNDRRYGRPWLGKLNGKMLTKDYTFIAWDGRNGHGGIFEFDAEPGQIIAHGQKDFRKNRGGIDGYYICLPDGTMHVLSNAIAYRSLPFAERCEKFIALRKANGACNT